MSNINIKRFVDIKISQHVYSSVNSLRDTAVLLSTETSTSDKSDETYSRYSDFSSAQKTIENVPLTDAYAKVYFDNGGQKLRVIYGVTSSTLGDIIKSLPNEQIVVAYTGSYNDIKAAASTRHQDESIYGINTKLLLGRTSSDDAASVENFAVKYSSENGAEMTIAAYLSKIDIYGVNSIKDYAFTKEVLTAEESDDDVLGTVLSHDMNVVMNLANADRNLGGNTKDGSDLVNTFVLIVLHQTLTERILNLLTSKIKGQAGLAAIQTVMAEELGRYVTNGYLSQDKVWTDNDLTVTYNNQTYTIIEQDTPLQNGYYISILPLASLTDEDKQLRKVPPIYVIVADSYGIRTVTVKGEVI